MNWIESVCELNVCEFVDIKNRLGCTALIGSLDFSFKP